MKLKYDPIEIDQSHHDVKNVGQMLIFLKKLQDKPVSNVYDLDD